MRLTYIVQASVTSPPENGKANQALVRLLADEWKMPRSSISLAAGSLSRNKVILIEGWPDSLMQQLK